MAGMPDCEIMSIPEWFTCPSDAWFCLDDIFSAMEEGDMHDDYTMEEWMEENCEDGDPMCDALMNMPTEWDCPDGTPVSMSEEGCPPPVQIF